MRGNVFMKIIDHYTKEGTLCTYMIIIIGMFYIECKYVHFINTDINDNFLYLHYIIFNIIIGCITSL